MAERSITIESQFKDEQVTAKVIKELKSLLKQYDSYLYASLKEIPLDDKEYQENREYDDIHIESISKNKNSIFLSGTASRYGLSPTFFVDLLAQKGALKTVTSEQGDHKRVYYYFLDGKKVTKKIFFSDVPKKPLTQKQKEIEAKLYLPKGRVLVKAELLEFEWFDDEMYGEFCVMFMKTDKGDEFIYKGTSKKLIQVTLERYNNHCEFFATFEKGKYNKKHVSFVKRPTKVKFYPKQK